MQSIRNLARAAPRTISRLSTARPATAAFLPQTLRSTFQSPASLTFPRTFSSSLLRRDDAAVELAAKLQQEIAFEAADDEGGEPASYEAVKDWHARNETGTANQTWAVQDVEGEPEVLLTRKYDDETISVVFSIADFDNPAAQMDEEMDDAFEDEELAEAQSGGAQSKGAGAAGRTAGGNVAVEENAQEYDELDAQDEQAFPASVDVLIQRPAKGALRVNLIADAGGFNIQSVTHIPDNKHTASLSAAELLRSPTVTETTYAGPAFAQLDENVQNLLENYLSVRGLDSALAVFIPEYIDVKEQREYVGWLNRVKSFVE